MRIVWLLILALGCNQVEKLSDAAAAASVALREERRTANELGAAMEAVADSKDATQIETKMLPALERYVSALDTAIAKSSEVQALEQDPKGEQQIDVYRKRAAAYHRVRDQLVALRGKPDEMARALPGISSQLMAAP